MVRGWIDALPPSFTRGVIPVRTLVSGGVRIPNSKASNKMIFLCFQSYSSRLIVKDMRMTGSPRLRHPPRKRGGQGV